MRIGQTFLVAMFFGLGLSACANTPPAFSDADRSAIRSAVDSFTAAVNKGDYATAASLYTEDGVIMPPNAPAVTGRTGIQKSLEGFGRVSAFSQPVIEVDGVGDLAYARMSFNLTLTPPGSPNPVTDKGKVLIVVRKGADGQWRTSRGMFNSDLAPPR
jgi:uncharacterized protein (TIGR02246 family)